FRFTAGQVMHDRDRALVLGLFSPEVPKRRVADPELAREVTKFVAAAIEWQLAARAGDVDESVRQQWRAALTRLVDPTVTPTIAAVEAALVALLQDGSLFAESDPFQPRKSAAESGGALDLQYAQETAATMRVPVDRIRLAERSANRDEDAAPAGAGLGVVAGLTGSGADGGDSPRTGQAPRRVFPTPVVEIDTGVAGRRVEPDDGADPPPTSETEYRTAPRRLIIDDFAAPAELEAEQEWEPDRRSLSPRVKWIGVGVAVVAVAVIGVGLIIHQEALTSPSTVVPLHPGVLATHPHKGVHATHTASKGVGGVASGATRHSGAAGAHQHGGRAAASPVTLPTVTGQGSVQAFAHLLRAGVAPAAIHVHTEQGPTPGTVISERRVADGVALTVSVPKGDALLPDLIGLTRAQAISELLARDFGYLYYLKAHAGAPGIVYAEQPRPLAVIPIGTKVTIDVSAHY
ncbi:MAG: hypothetical protein OWT27_00240, partial [Firmicutes bacterium]|nr:hypothetical protein [Bacillota bacterium]